MNPNLNPNSKCTHRTPDNWQWVNDFESPPEFVNMGGNWTYENCGVGRFRCSQCGEVGYYTGLWRSYYEEGVPCSGSEGVPRDLPPLANPAAASRIQQAIAFHKAMADTLSNAI